MAPEYFLLAGLKTFGFSVNHLKKYDRWVTPTMYSLRDMQTELHLRVAAGKKAGVDNRLGHFVA